MAISSPALALSVEALFGNVKPALDLIKKLGPTDFSDEAPGIDIKPGSTIKTPLSTVSAALAFNDSTNNYLTGGTTDWATLTATHYLQGFDLRGTDLDAGLNAARVKQLFALRCGTGIALAARNAIRTALDNTTAIATSTAVTIPAVGSADLADYDGLAQVKDWFDPTASSLVVNAAEYANIKQLMHTAHLSATPESIAAELGFAAVIVLPGMTSRALIVPYSTIGFVARVPQIIADFKEAGVETDPDSGLSIGIVVANEQKLNRQVVNGDLWFGVATVGSAAAATTPGIIRVGTAT